MCMYLLLHIDVMVQKGTSIKLFTVHTNFPLCYRQMFCEKYIGSLCGVHIYTHTHVNIYICCCVIQRVDKYIRQDKNVGCVIKIY